METHNAVVADSGSVNPPKPRRLRSRSLDVTFQLKTRLSSVEAQDWNRSSLIFLSLIRPHEMCVIVLPTQTFGVGRRISYLDLESRPTRVATDEDPTNVCLRDYRSDLHTFNHRYGHRMHDEFFPGAAACIVSAYRR